MKRAHKQNGYISLPILLFLLLLMVLAFGAAAFMFYLRKPLEVLHDYNQTMATIGLAKTQFIKALNADQTPDIDSFDDPVFALNGTLLGGFTLTVEDVSSKLPINWININILENTTLASVLNSGVSMQQLNDHREDVGYGYDITKKYMGYIRPEALKKYFTAFGWANINVSSEETLSDLYQFRLDSAGSVSEFKSKVRQKLLAKELWKDSELPQALGAGQTKAYPSINTLPLMNVNFAPADIIGAVITYPFPDGLIENAAAISANLSEARISKAIDPALLKLMIPIKKAQQERVFCYLGTRTWFWKLTLTNDTEKYALIFSIAPDLTSGPSVDKPKGIIRLILVKNELKNTNVDAPVSVQP